jgi:hypothetical protein
MQAADYAQQTSSDPWEFAVGLDELQRQGLFVNDLRLLAKTGLVEQANEITRPACDGREFQPTRSLRFTKHACFILTSRGIDVARNTCDVGLDAVAMCATPKWNGEVHELLFRGLVVKKFKAPAKNQEAILAAFEEEGWPSHIDDPIPPDPEKDSPQRLHDAVKGLNRHQVNRLLCFHGDGRGEGVIWEPLTPPNLPKKSDRSVVRAQRGRAAQHSAESDRLHA